MLSMPLVRQMLLFRLDTYGLHTQTVTTAARNTPSTVISTSKIKREEK